MTTPAEFARIKNLFQQLSELGPADRAARLAELAESEAPEIIAEVRTLLGRTQGNDQRFAGPIAEALAALLPDGPASGEVLDAWTLCEELGHGGMGKVFRAIRSDGHFDQVAAVKVLNGLPSPRALEHLARERQVLATLSHPGISRLLDGGSTPGGQPYFVMEFVQGQPIHRYCRERGVSLQRRLRLMIEVCAAVAYAHQRLIIHCDLKPSNILVNEQGRPILLDFGIARTQLAEEPEPGVDGALSSSHSATAAGKAYTPRYASPEQIDGGRVGTSTDVYSLGLVLAELLDARHLETSELALDGLPADLRAIIRCATRPDPDTRYASAAALAADLERYLDRQPVSAQPRTSAYLVARWLSRRWPAALAGVAFFATVIGLSLQMRSERDAAVSSERAARAVIDFMVSVFQGADPEISGGRDLPISELLDAGRDRLDESLADQPLVRTEMAAILGGVYQTIGRRDQAQALFDRALAAESDYLPPARRADLLHRKAYTTYDQEDFAAAEPLAREAVALRESHEPDTIRLMDSLRLLGSILTYRGDTEESLALLDRSLELARRIAGPDSVEAGRVHLDLGRHYVFYDVVGDDILEHALAAQRIFAAHRGPDHFLYVDALEILAYGHASGSDFERAIPLVREVAEKRIALYGEISYQAGYGLFSHAFLLDSAGRRFEALPIAKRCLDIQEQLDGVEALSATFPRRMVADIQLNVGLYNDAVGTYGELADIHARLQPDDVRINAENQLRLGRAKRLAGDLAGAAPHTEAALEAYLTGLEAVPTHRARAQLERARLLRELGQPDEARAMLASIDPAALKDVPRQRADVALEQALLDALDGAWERALTGLLAAETIVVGELGEDNPDSWLFRLDRAEFLARTGEPAAARSLAIAIAEHAETTIAPQGALAARLAALTSPRPP